MIDAELELRFAGRAVQSASSGFSPQPGRCAGRSQRASKPSRSPGRRLPQRPWTRHRTYQTGKGWPAGVGASPLARKKSSIAEATAVPSARVRVKLGRLLVEDLQKTSGWRPVRWRLNTTWANAFTSCSSAPISAARASSSTSARCGPVARRSSPACAGALDADLLRRRAAHRRLDLARCLRTDGRLASDADQVRDAVGDNADWGLSGQRQEALDDAVEEELGTGCVRPAGRPASRPRWQLRFAGPSAPVGLPLPSPCDASDDPQGLDHRLSRGVVGHCIFASSSLGALFEPSSTTGLQPLRLHVPLGHP